LVKSIFQRGGKKAATSSTLGKCAAGVGEVKAAKNVGSAEKV
jgi:hypothetical protein